MADELSSPFPGVDPYLEDPAFWREFHGKLVHEIHELILQALPDGYDARVDESMRLERVESSGSRYPDVAVTRTDIPPDRAASTGGAVATVEPIAARAMRAKFDPEEFVWIEIRHRKDRSLVTIVEVISPANKEGNDYFDYMQRRSELIRTGANMVEIDLLLQGWSVIESSAESRAKDFGVYVSRAFHPDDIKAYMWSMPDVLPRVPIPLRPPDPDIGLDLAPAYRTAYQRGRYRRVLDYTKPPVAALKERLTYFVRQTAHWA